MNPDLVYSISLADSASSADSRAPLAADHSGGKRERRLTLVILVVAGFARLPFLWRGFGGHPDEWLVVRSGLDFWLNGTYFPSRIPGYPLDEILMGALAWLGGATACAIAATIASLIMLAYMRALAPLHGIRDSFWMILAFSFEPWVWSSGTHDMDYIWGTCALVAGVYYVERRRFGAAGLACAVGFGFRPTSLLWIAPLFFRVLLIEQRWRSVLRFALWAAVPALVPASLMVYVLLTRPDAWVGTDTETVRTVKHLLISSSMMAGYHLIELFGHLPAVLLIIAGCWTARDRFVGVLRGAEGWVWNYLLIFISLFGVFVIESGKPEYMLPALPGVFMILGRGLSNNWWKAITIAFIVNAFISFGFGHAPRPGGLHIEMTAPSLRPGALLWYAERAKDSNDRVAATGSELAEPSRIIRADPELDRLDDFYVSSLLTRGPPGQARISCPLVPARLSFPQNAEPEISRANDLSRPLPSHYPMLICCSSKSALVLSDTPPQADRLAEGVGQFCAAPTR